LLVVISVTSSIHLLTAFVRGGGASRSDRLLAAAGQVGNACLWAAITTAAGFASFLWSDLASFRHFGFAAASGLALAFASTFILLPALIVLGPEINRDVRLAGAPLRQIEAALRLVRARPGFIALAGSAALALMIAGAPRLYYSIDFGDQSFVLRSVRFIEANLGKPMTTELSVTIPLGQRIYQGPALELLAELEAWFEGEPTTGRVWSFLDFLEEAFRIESGSELLARGRLVETAAAQMPLVLAYEDVTSYWSEERLEVGGVAEWRDRGRVSARRGWLDAAAQVPYVQRLREFVAEVNARVSPAGFHVALEGGLELAALAEERIRDTQLRSFASAFLSVSLILVWLLRRNPGLAVAAVLANLLPVAALLGVMGWAGIGIDPANTMVAAVLLGIVVDDTLHVALGIEARGGPVARGAVEGAIRAVGPALFITSVCLALGFAVLMFSRWGGLVSFGLLASVGIGLAFAADLLLLPAVLVLVRARRIGS
jgi:predicted RND superfamily exporter protein